MDHPATLLAIQRYRHSTRDAEPSAAALASKITQLHLYEGRLAGLPPLSLFPAATRLVAPHNDIRELGEEGEHASNALEDVDLSYNMLRQIPWVGGAMTFTLNLRGNCLRGALVAHPLPNLLELCLADQVGPASATQRAGAPEGEPVFCEQPTESAMNILPVQAGAGGGQDPSPRSLCAFSRSLATFAPRLRAFDISNTGVTSLVCVSGLPALSKLEARGNPLATVESVVPFLPPTLLSLDLSGCPVQKKYDLFDSVCLACPKIREFCGKEYSAEQVRFSAQKARNARQARQARRPAGGSGGAGVGAAAKPGARAGAKPGANAQAHAQDKTKAKAGESMGGATGAGLPAITGLSLGSR